MSHKLIISNFYQNHMLGFQLENHRLVRVHNFNSDSVVGNIYCGYVKDVVKNLNAAFIEFDQDKKGFFHFKENAGKIHQGDKVLIQVSGDKIKTKDYLLTSDINLNSECLVLTVGKTDISISRKIKEKQTRESLKRLLKKYENDEYGFILRTNSVNYPIEKIQKQAEDLIEQWTDIKRKFEHATFRSILLKNDILINSCNEYIQKFHGKIITDNIAIFDKLKSHHIQVQINQAEKISLCNKYSLEKHLREALGRKVWLKSGAYLIIEPTEALTVIDVNTGKADFKTNCEKTFQKINCEAAVEIARQMQVRNLSGIIIVDFINMKTEENYAELKQLMDKTVANDFCPCSIVGFTKLGLMEISRKKKEKPLFEILRSNEI